MHMLGEKSQAEVGGRVPDSLELKQRRRMQIALALLVLALIVVLYRDWQLFPSASPSQSETRSDASSPAVSTSQPSLSTKPRISLLKPKSHPNPPAAAKEAPGAVATASNRTVLPPLEVEVVAGDQHRKVPTINPSIRLDLRSGDMQNAPSQASSDGGSSDLASSTTAGDVRVSAGAAKVVSRPVQPEYPILARQMKVQGSVVLQALIDKAGKIEDLRVLSGPTMLSAAARQAVVQWSFKPYFVAGEPVETETRITVNFTISTN
jgi:periplasmic protein TonB